MLIDYLGQVANYKKKIGTNIYGEPMFEEKEIACRIVDKFKQVTNEKGDVVVSSSVIQCMEIIKVGDYISDKKIIAVNSAVGLDGVIGYRGYLL